MPHTFEQIRAYHEAGDAVLAWESGIPINRASVKPDCDSAGRVEHERAMDQDTWCAQDDNAKVRAEREIRVARAGALAVKIKFPKAKWRRGDGDDRRNVVNLISHFYSDHRAQYWWSRRCAFDAENVLRRYWHAVEAVAQALLARETLSGT